MSILRFVLTALLSLSTAHAQTLRTSYTPTANFAYQLDCISGQIRSCEGKADYTKLWTDTFNVNPATNEDVKRWVALRARYEQLTANNDGRGGAWPFDGIHLPHRVLRAGLTASDLKDYQSRLALVLPDVDTREAQRIVETLYAPFAKWWAAHAETVGKPKADTMAASLQSPPIVREVRATFDTLGKPEAARVDAVVHLMLRPGLVPLEGTSGQNLGIDSVAELELTDRPEDRVPVIIHEYAHFVFGALPREKGLALRADIIKAGGAAGGALWGLFNEAQASALGNGRTTRALMSEARFNRYFGIEGSFYADNAVDAVGKALLPLFDEMVAKGESVFAPTFAAQYAKAVRDKMGNALLQPGAFTKEMALFASNALNGALPNEVVRITRTGSMWSHIAACCDDKMRDTFNKERDKTRLIILTPEELTQASHIPTALRVKLNTETEKSKDALLLGVDFPPDESAVIVVLGRDLAGITRALENLMKQATLSARVWAVN
jgi:hypothetical protein